MLRPYFLFRRELLTELARAAYETVLELMVALVDDHDAGVGMVVAIQTFSDNLKWNPHQALTASLALFSRRRPPSSAAFFRRTAAGIAYVSNASGRFEGYVQPFPGPGLESQVSTDGGTNPVWARSGREIFYRSEDRVMAVAVETEPALRLSKPRILFEERFLQEAEGVVGFAQYDVASDDEHFIMIRDESLVSRIHVVPTGPRS